VLNLLIHIFLSKTRILPFSGDLCTLLNGHFQRWPQNDSKKSKNDRHLLREKRAQKCRFWVEKVEISNELLKMHTKGQNKLTKKSKQKFSFLVKKSSLLGKIEKCRSWPPFCKSRFWRFFEGSSSAVCCPIELKIL
jgi:hypothetical protein